jgi:hypothetical protein
MPPAIPEQNLSASFTELSRGEQMHANGRRSGQRALPWLALVCILVAYVVAVVHLHPTSFLGYTRDDATYFSSAQAIAQGRDYVLPSVPGTPPGTEYPVLYPWILSWVWRWNPSFPANLTDAVGVTVFFGLVFVTLIFMFLRQLGGVNDTEALLITAFCALHPVVVFYGANIVAEIPFAALALGAIVVAEKATRRDSSVRYALLCGMLAGACTDLRMIGVAVVAGIAVAALLRRAWRQFVIFCASSSALVLPVVWRGLAQGQKMPHLTASATTNFGWTRTWQYYTSYSALYRASIPDFQVFSAMLKTSVSTVLRTPSDYLLFPSLGGPTFVALAVSVVLTGVILAGVFRQARQRRWKPVHCVLPFYAVVALLWTFNEFYRFFIPFLPLFVAGYWAEMKYLFGLLQKAIAKQQRQTDMVVAGAFVAAIFGVSVAVVRNYFGPGREMISAIARERAALAPAKQEAYVWISRSKPNDSRIVTYEDASLYLYAGRQAMRPIVFTAAEMFEPERMKNGVGSYLGCGGNDWRRILARFR